MWIWILIGAIVIGAIIGAIYGGKKGAAGGALSAGLGCGYILLEIFLFGLGLFLIIKLFDWLFW